MSTVRRLPFLVCAAALAGPAAAQDAEADEAGAGIAEASQRLLSLMEPGWRLLSSDTLWSLAIARISEGARNRIAFLAEAGRDYRIVGAGATAARDLDICVVTAEAPDDEISCDVLPDALPIVEFRANATGLHVAELRAATVEGPWSYAGVAVLARASPSASAADPSVPREIATVTTLGALTSFAGGGWDLVPADLGRGPAAGLDNWSLALGAARQDVDKRLFFEVEAGRAYQVSGAGDATASDLDICVTDDAGGLVACDDELDARPQVAFTAESSGRYAAVLRPYAIASASAAITGASGPPSSRGGLVVAIRDGGHCDTWRREPDYFERATVVDVENCMSGWLETAPHDFMLGTPLIHAAAQSKFADVVESLLRVPGLDTLEAELAPPLLVGAARYSPIAGDVVGLLLDHNPGLLDSYSMEYGTPLHAAVSRRDADVGAIDRMMSEIVEQRREDLLLSTNEGDETPLLAAARAAMRPVVVRSLVDGAPREARRRMLIATDPAGNTALDIARDRKDGGRIAAQLEEYDAEYVNPSLWRRVSRLREPVEALLASAAGIVLFLFTFIRTFPQSRIARLVHGIFNKESVAA